jgi:hypothetical protein
LSDSRCSLKSGAIGGNKTQGLSTFSGGQSQHGQICTLILDDRTGDVDAIHRKAGRAAAETAVAIEDHRCVHYAYPNSVELRFGVAAALEFKESRSAGNQQGAIPQSTGIFAQRNGSDDRSKESNGSI